MEIDLFYYICTRILKGHVLLDLYFFISAKLLLKGDKCGWEKTHCHICNEVVSTELTIIFCHIKTFLRLD